MRIQEVSVRVREIVAQLNRIEGDEEAAAGIRNELHILLARAERLTIALRACRAENDAIVRALTAIDDKVSQLQRDEDDP